MSDENGREQFDFGSVIERSRHEIYIFDAESLKFLVVNAGARESLGYAIEELRRMTPLDIKPEFDAAGFEQLIAPLRDGSRPSIVFETVHLRRSGDAYPVSIRLELSVDNGRAVFVAYCVDLSSERDAQDRLNQIMEQAIDAVVSIDERNEVTYFNAAAEALWGVAREKVLGRNVSMLTPADIRAQHDDMIASNRSTGVDKIVGTSRDVLLERLDDGRRIWANLALSKVRIGDGITYTAFVKDISRQRSLEQHSAERLQLALLNERFQSVLDTVANGVLALDAEGRVQLANPAARHMLGGVSEATPFDWPGGIKFIDPKDMRPLENELSPVRRALRGVEMRGEVYLMTRSQSSTHRYVKISSAAIAGQDPELNAVLVLDDVTNEENSRQQFERRGRLDALGQLTGGIAHDFNNLLATIQYSIQIALLKLEKLDVHDVDDYLSRSQNSIRRGAALTKRLLAFARRQPGLAKSQPVRDLLHEFGRLSAPTIEESISIQFVQEDPDLWVFCDPAQLENALLNLVLNSRDAIARASKGEKIVVSARGIAELDADIVLRKESPFSYIAKGLHAEHASMQARPSSKAYRYVEFAVTDDGPGMTDEVKRRALDPFFTTKEKQSGSGLGLSMVYGFVQQSSGELRIYSEVGHGTTVRMILPRGTSQGLREEPVERLPAPKGAGQTILVVEDEAALLEIMCEMVGELGYRAERCESGRQALERLESGAPVDLLLTDVVMPGGISGFELARRARGMRPTLPIIYLSGYTGFTDKDMGEVVAPLVQKPCPPVELAEALKKALDAAAT